MKVWVDDVLCWSVSTQGPRGEVGATMDEVLDGGWGTSTATTGIVGRKEVTRLRNTCHYADCLQPPQVA